MFIDASRDFEPGSNQNRLSPAHLKRIVTTYRNRQTVERYETLITRDKIVQNDYSLNVSRCVDVFLAENAIDLKDVQSHINDLETKLTDVKMRMAAYLEELELDRS